MGVVPGAASPIPAFAGGQVPGDFRQALAQAVEHLTQLRPEHVCRWRDQLAVAGMSNATITRKLAALRSLFSYLQTYGYSGANPAYGKDGKTVGLSPHDCRRLLDAPTGDPAKLTPVDCRDRALLAVLAYSGCRVGELVRLKGRDFKISGEHRILVIMGKGGKERTTPLHLEAVERITDWLAVPGINESGGALFLAPRSARGMGRDGFTTQAMSTRAVEKLIGRYVKALGLDRIRCALRR